MAGKPAAIEAYWDGDTAGWSVRMEAIIEGGGPEHPRFRSIYLGQWCDGGDFRLFVGEVPPWPEAVRAVEIGEALARALEVPFHFASRDQPRDECVRWWNLGGGRPCDDCGIELQQEDGVPWSGVCYPCHLARERRMPCLRIEGVTHLAREDSDRIYAVVRAALGANYVRSMSSSVPGDQWHSFTIKDGGGATTAAFAALRETGLLARVRLLVAPSAHEPAVLVTP